MIHVATDVTISSVAAKLALPASTVSSQPSAIRRGRKLRPGGLMRTTINVLGCSILLLALFAAASCQDINSTYADLSIPGKWQDARQFASGNFGSEVFYDSSAGSVLLVAQRSGLQKVGEIAKFFTPPAAPSKEAAALMSSAEFQLPVAYTDRASRDIAKGEKPPKLWDLKEGDGNPVWFYASQLFEEYRVHNVGGSSEITEQYFPVRVVKAEQRTVSTGDLLLFAVETDKPANDSALKRFKLPASLKDQRIRFCWVQFAPGGIASGSGVLSVGYATSAASGLDIDELAKQVSAAKIKPL